MTGPNDTSNRDKDGGRDKNGDQNRHARLQLYADACERLFGRKAERIAFPGGSNRKSAVVTCGDDAWVFSRRASAARAELEAGVLGELHRLGAPVPAPVAQKDAWIVQQFLPGERLSTAMDGMAPDARTRWLDEAIRSLALIHEAGRRAGLERRVVVIGARAGWIEQLIDMPRRLALELALPPPVVPADGLRSRLTPKRPRFIKWDARPGNALAGAGGDVFWFDWEHCGCRDPLDDLAWLLGDEWAPDDDGMEGALLARHLGAFADGRSADEARACLMAFGAFHMAVRLSLIVEHRGDGPWWDRAYSLAHDKIGVTPDGVARLCARGARWASADGATAPLAAWFRAAGDRILARR
ncbi:MAG: hypothetical protein RL477_1840 [Pseudomonadota bacterium]|jgi:aminoglycoside phosphotransferase (APT) family kinase protein